MKLTMVFLLAACIHVSATGFGQKVSISGKDLPLEKVFSIIKKQTDYVFFYDYSIFQGAKNVSLDLKNVEVEDALRVCLQGQNLEFTITNKTISITRHEKKTAFRGSYPAKPDENYFKAQGIVLAENGQPLSGASVTLKETKKTTLTNVKGEFQLPLVAENNTIIVSYIGYEAKKVKVTKDAQIIRIVLGVTKNELDKVVIQGYGTTSQRFATGNIATVTSEEIEKQPVMNPLLALQGRVAGLDIVQTSGYASAPIKVEIRGRSNIDPNQISDPLYIVDGVPLTVLEIGGQSYNGRSAGFFQNGTLVGPANGQSPLFGINPSDIESVSILKDADATSIYGSRGANGVIIITTKKGKVGKSHIDIHVEQGVNKVTRYWKMLNTPEYLTMRREAFRNDGITPDISNALDLMSWDTTRYTDWQKAIYGKAGRVTDAQLSVSGGDAQTSFRLGGTYTNSQEITTASGADQRGAVSLNLTHNSLNQKLSISFTASYSFTKSNMVNISGNIALAPDAPSIYDSSGKLNWKDWESYASGYPFGSLLQQYTAKTDFLNSNVVFSYQPIRGLSFKTSIGYNTAQANQTFLIPIASQDPNTQPTGSAQFGYNTNKNWIIEPQITYEAQIGSGKLTALIGGSAQGNTTEGIITVGSGYTSDALLHTISNAPNQASTDNYGVYRYASIFGRLGFNLENKYIINLNGRRDGSSNYGPGNQFGNFASIGGAWIFSEENWFKKYARFLSFGKLRGSYGIAGSDGGIPYGYITRWASAQTTYQGIVPLVATQHANPNYEWQVNKKLEGAIDLGFFKDWVTLSVAHYRNRTGNQLLAYPTPLFSGFQSVIDNLNALVENAGWEFTIAGKGIHVHSKYFKWDWAPHFNFSINQNKFLSFSGLGSSPFRNQGLIGQPLNGVYILHYIGVDPQTGIYTYLDKNHDGVINPNYGDKGDVFFKKTSPTFSTGFGFNFDIAGVSLNMLFILKKQTGINALAQGRSPGRFGANQPVEVLARWQNPGDIANVGKFSTVQAQDPNGYLGNSDIGYTDASYIRLQNLSISYNLTDHFIKKAPFKCNIFFHTNNLFTITKYKGIDPETQNFGSLPPLRTSVGGFSFEF